MRDLRGEDLSIVVTSAAGAPISSLSEGIESFSVKPVLEKIEQKNLDGRRINQTMNGWSGSINLNLRRTASQRFMDAYVISVQSKLEFRVNLMQKVYDPSLLTSIIWMYPKCTLEFDEGEYSKSSAVKLKITWETGENRVQL